jgi:hypothetical protein
MNKKIFTLSALIMPLLISNSSHAVTCIKPRQCGPLEAKSKYECADGFIRVSKFNHLEDQKGELINNNAIYAINSALSSPKLNFHDGIVDYKSLRISGFASAMSQRGFGYSQTGSPNCDQFIASIKNKELFKVNLTASMKGSSNRIIIKSDIISYKGGGFSPMMGTCIASTNVSNDKGIYYNVQIPLNYRDIQIEYIPLDSTIMQGNQIKFSGLNPEKESYLEMRGIK